MLDVFGEVEVLARVSHIPAQEARHGAADGPRVRFIDVPFYRGLSQYMMRHREVNAVVSRAVNGAEAIILRVPGAIGSLAFRSIAPGRPYGVQVSGDPYDVFAPGSVRHPLRPLIRWKMTKDLKRMCRHAAAGLYVTERTLQQRYPTDGQSFGVANVQLFDDAVRDSPRVYTVAPVPLEIITVGSLQHRYKGTDLILRAIAQCSRVDFQVRVTVVGDGRCRAELVSLAGALGIMEQVRFIGELRPGPAVRACLDQADMFVLPSRTEGLPRAMIEAMARGLPCIGSKVGGIPELLDADSLIEPGDVEELARKLYEFGTDPIKLTAMAQANLATAQRYRAAELHEGWQRFCSTVAAQTRQRCGAPPMP